MFFVIPEPPHDNPVCMSSCACYPVHVILNGPSFVGPVKDLAPPTKTLRSSKPSLKGDKPASLSSWNTRRLCVAILSSCACYPVHVILNGPSLVGPVKDLAPQTKTLRSTPSLQGDKPASLSSWN